MKYHFIGIKGSGMSPLAQIMKGLGYDVQGSDKTDYFFTQKELERMNIGMLPFDPNNITKDMEVIIGNSFGDNHPEVIRAKELGVKTHRYYDVLGDLTRKYKSIAISGCHGKTTTTGLMAHVFDNTVKANYLIGDGTGYADKNNDYFILEACEYQRNFLHYYPTYTIITNIDLDHVDYYKDIADIKDAFQSLVNQTSDLVIACGDNQYVRELKYKKVMFYGFNSDNDIIAKNIEFTPQGSSFDVEINKEYFGHFNLPLFGQHMILNALAVIGIAHYEGIKQEDIAQYIATFKGVQRRFSEKIIGDIITIDDYAHHPAEVKATMQAARQKYPDKKLIVVFKGHTYSRVKELWDGFIEALSTADEAYIGDIYCRTHTEKDFPGISGRDMAKQLPNGHYIDEDSIDQLLQYQNAVILFMSAADITKMKEKYEQLLKDKLITV